MSGVKKMIYTALFIALGVVIPTALHSIPNAGGVFLPMHIPVLLCGLICGFPYGLVCGIAAPLLSNLLTGMPPAAMLPSMLAELAAYGAVSSLLIRVVRTKNIYANVYAALTGAMLSGRVLYGVLNALIFRAGNYSARMWAAAAFVTAVPGIVIQIVLIPAVVFALARAKLADGAVFRLAARK